MKIGSKASGFCLGFLLAASTALAAPAVEWSTAIPLPDAQWALEVLPVADGYVLVGGDFRYPGDPAAGGSDACVLTKIDLAGVPLWRRTFTPDRLNDCWGVAPAADGGFVVSGTAFPGNSQAEGRITLIRTDAAGNLLWTKFFDANDAAILDTTIGYGIRATADGGFVVLGARSSADQPSAIMLLKVDADGNELWRTFPEPLCAEAFELNPTADGGFIIGGSRYVGPESPLAVNPADYHVWMLRVDASGRRVWSADYAVPGGATGRAARQTPDGGFALVGYTGSFVENDRIDALLLKVDAAGRKQWATTFGGAGEGGAYDLAIAADGGILVTGAQSPADLHEELLSVTKFSADGRRLWDVLANGAPPGVPGFAMGASIKTTPDGGAIAAGSVHANNPGSAGDGGDCDIWVVKVGPVADPPPITVAIDVKPGSAENPINLKAKGTVPVAVLTTGSFDAASVDPATVLFAGAPVATKPNGTLQWSLEDVDGDGDQDLLLHFDIPALQLAVGDTTAALTGTTRDGAGISGSDTVRVTATAAAKKAKKKKKK